MDHYLKELAPRQLVINGYDLWPVEQYNVAPSTRVQIIRPAGKGLSVDKVKWGWAPFLAKGKRPDPINARVETLMTGKIFQSTVARWSRTRTGEWLVRMGQGLR